MLLLLFVIIRVNAYIYNTVVEREKTILKIEELERLRMEQIKKNKNKCKNKCKCKSWSISRFTSRSTSRSTSMSTIGPFLDKELNEAYWYDPREYKKGNIRPYFEKKYEIAKLKAEISKDFLFISREDLLKLLPFGIAPENFWLSDSDYSEDTIRVNIKDPQTSDWVQKFVRAPIIPPTENRPFFLGYYRNYQHISNIQYYAINIRKWMEFILSNTEFAEVCAVLVNSINENIDREELNKFE